MSEMVERVARAIYAQIPNGGTVRIPNTLPSASNGRYPLPYDLEYQADKWEEAPDRHEQCLNIARAAIEAMREPTDRMNSEGASAASFGIGKPTDEEAIPRVWHAMIDAALRENA